MNSKTRLVSAVKPVQAIPTRYSGCKMRSRLEARWAVTFDAMGLSWTYEPEGFLLSTGPYLPDFYIQNWDLWVETKPKHNFETSKVGAFAKEKAAILLLCGTPGRHRDYNAWLLCYDSNGKEATLEVDFCLQSEKAPVLIGDCEYDGEYYTSADLTTKLTQVFFPIRAEEWLLEEAMEAGRGARFEHGERGAGN